MAKILVVYYSRGATTEKMAELVVGGAREAGAEVDVKKVTETTPDDLLLYDGIIASSPTYYGQMAWEMKKLFDESVKHHKKLDGKVGGAFTSSGVIGGGNETTILSILGAMLVRGMIIQGYPGGDHYGPVAVGMVDDRAARLCATLGARVAELAARLA